MDDARTLEILKQVERGELAAEQANARLNAPPTVEREYMPRVEAAQAPSWVRAIWIYLLVSGLAVVGIGAWIIAATSNVNLLWLLCGLPILLLGALILALGADLQSAHWVYINVAQSRRSKRPIRIAVPFPIGLVKFGLWIVKWFKPDLKIKMGKAGSFNASWQDVEDFIKEVERTLSKDGGMSVDVDDNGERVQVHIV
jgi:hypothetical protein